MSQIREVELPKTEPKTNSLTLDNWKRGVITLIDDSKLPKNALAQAENILLVEDGQPAPRWGVGWYGTAPVFYNTGTAAQTDTTVTGTGTTFTSAMVGMTIVWDSGETAVITAYTSATSVEVDTEQAVSDGDYDIFAPIDGFNYHDTGTTVHILQASGGKIWRSTDNASTWTECTGATYTAGNRVLFNQNGGYSFITTGVDNIVRYDGTTTLATYTALATPTLTSAVETGMTGTDYTYKYRIARVNEVGFSIASTGVTETTDTPRSEWVNGSKYVTLTLPAYVTDQTRFDIYISDDNGVNYYYLDSVNNPTLTYVDDGTAVPIPSTKAPEESTAQGPKVEELINVGSRMYGVRDSDNSARIWWTGAGTFAGSFSTAYDGGWLDWQEGGKNRPVQVRSYRDGKGNPYATVWCDSADGRGTVLQMQLEILTIGDVSITVPSAYELPGSRGTSAPQSVINVLNDYHFYNSQAFYNLGSRQNLQQILSTDEMSANIRPDVKRIAKNAEDHITAIYYDAKVFFSVPYGSTTNNAVAVFDTERQAWLPEAFTIGFEQFLQYTDTNGNQTLLAYKADDYKLSEISPDILGDYGVPFKSIVKTGLYPTTKDRFDFQWTEEGEFELSRATGIIDIDLFAYDRRDGYKAVKSPRVNVQTSIDNTGWDTYAWDKYNWDKTDVEITISTESSIKRYFNIQDDLNSVQWKITTNGLNSYYILRTLQTWGTQTFAGKPRGWKLQG